MIVEGTILGYGGDEFSIVYFYILVGRLVFSHWVICCLLVLLLYLLILLCLSLLEHATFKSISKRRGGGNENSLSRSRRRPGMVIG